MKKTILLVSVFSCSFLNGHAQQPFLQPSPLNLWNHVYWQALGNRSGQEWGVNGLDTLGRIADSVPQALSIAELDDPMPGGPTVSSYILNRKPVTPLRPDTARIYQFPGDNVIRCDLNGDGKADFVVYNYNARTVTVLMGKDTINEFDTVAVLRGVKDQFQYLFDRIIVADVDLSGYPSIVIFDNFSDSHGNDTARVLLYHGGAVLDTVPVIATHGHNGTGELAIGRVKDSEHLYLCEGYGISNDTEKVYLYPFGKTFSLLPTDSIICTIDTTRYSNLGDQGGFGVFDVNGDGIDDILLEGYDNNYDPSLKIDKAVLVYKGGKNISPYPTYYFHRPFQTNSAAFGTKIIDIGNFTGRGYHSLLVTDPQANGDGGEIFLFNMGKALKDSCVGAATYGFSIGDGDGFGVQAAALGDLNGSGHTEFMVSSYAETQSTSGTGAVVVFSGDTSYGPVAVREPQSVPQYFMLAQNYPNPFSGETDITFSVVDAKLYGADLTLNIYDMLGKKLLTAYRGKADNYEYTIRVDASGLSAGDYYYRLECGGQEITRMMNVVK